MTFDLGILVVAGLLAVAALPVLHRIIAGPTILDRAVASDMLVVLVVMGMAVYTAWSRTVLAGTAMLSLTALAFLSTVAVARFAAREDPAGHTAEDRGGPQPDAAAGSGHDAIGGPGEAIEDASAGEVGTLEPRDADDEGDRDAAG